MSGRLDDGVLIFQSLGFGPGSWISVLASAPASVSDVGQLFSYYFTHQPCKRHQPSSAQKVYVHLHYLFCRQTLCNDLCLRGRLLYRRRRCTMATAAACCYTINNVAMTLLLLCRHSNNYSVTTGRRWLENNSLVSIFD